jgi:hypothetical protein
MRGHRGSRYSPSRGVCANLFPQQSLQSWLCLDALEAAGSPEDARNRLESQSTSRLFTPERCRDRAETKYNLLDFNGTDSPFLILEGILR